jgi:hypothetical protein
MDDMNNVASVRIEQKSGKFSLAVGYLAAIISLMLFPFIFGAAGIILGIVASKNGSRSGLTLIVTSIALMAAGMLFGVAIFSNIKYFLGF